MASLHKRGFGVEMTCGYCGSSERVQQVPARDYPACRECLEGFGQEWTTGSGISWEELKEIQENLVRCSEGEHNFEPYAFPPMERCTLCFTLNLPEEYAVRAKPPNP